MSADLQITGIIDVVDTESGLEWDDLTGVTMIETATTETAMTVTAMTVIAFLPGGNIAKTETETGPGQGHGDTGGQGLGAEFPGL